MKSSYYLLIILLSIDYDLWNSLEFVYSEPSVATDMLL